MASRSTHTFAPIFHRVILGRRSFPYTPFGFNDPVNLAWSPGIELMAIVCNDMGRAINGLELRGVVFDASGFPVRGRMAVIDPTQQTVLEPNEVIRARILLEDIWLDVERAKIRTEVTGVLSD